MKRLQAVILCCPIFFAFALTAHSQPATKSLRNRWSSPSNHPTFQANSVSSLFFQDRFVIFEGRKPSYHINLSEQKWLVLAGSNNLPQGATYVTHDSKLFAIGGYSNDSKGTLSNHVLSSRDAINWNPISQQAEFEPRWGAAAVSHKGYIYIAGGSGDKSKALWGYREIPAPRYNDTWRSTDGVSWELVDGNSDFGPRYNATLLSIADFVILVGGVDDSGKPLNDIWSITTDTSYWSQATKHAPFSPRTQMGVVHHKNHVYVIGGNDGVPRNDVWRSNNIVDWAEVSGIRGLPACQVLCAYSVGDWMYVVIDWSAGQRPSNLISLLRSTDGATWTLVD